MEEPEAPPPPPKVGGYPKSLPHIRDFAPLPKAYLPTPKYLPYKPYAPTPAPAYAPHPTRAYHPLKAIHLEPAVYKPKLDPYAAKLVGKGGYIG